MHLNKNKNFLINIFFTHNLHTKRLKCNYQKKGSILKYLFSIIIMAMSVFAKNNGPALYHSCKFCHGYAAEKKYMNIIPNLKDATVSELEVKLKLYKKGELDVYGYGSLMQMQMKNIPDDKIKELASYIETL